MNTSNDQSKNQQRNFKAACKEARYLLTAADRSDLLTRYKAGVIIRKVKESADYGENGVKRMEEELGRDQGTLYRYSTVVETWEEPEFKAQIKRTNAKGLPLTWSHYELLATVEDGRRRNGLITRALNECLSVHALRALMGSSESKAKRAATGEATEISPSGAIRHLDQALDAFEKEARSWEEQALPSLITSREKLKKKDVTRLTETLKRVNDAKTILGKLSDEIEKVLAPPEEQIPSRVVEAGPVAEAAAGA